MNPSQDVFKMCTVSHDTSVRRRRHWLMAATTIYWSSFLHLTPRQTNKQTDTTRRRRSRLFIAIFR